MANTEGPHSHNQGNDEKSEADRDRVREEAWAELGLPAPVYEEEPDVPPMDRAQFKKMVRDFSSLEEHDKDKVLELVLRFQSYADDASAVIREKHQGE